MESKTGKYFKYAIGEIALVMIGILLAIQVNSWNQNKINSVKEINYLKGIEADLKSQLQTMETVEKLYDSLVFSAGTILNDFQKFKSISKVPNLNKRISFLMWDTSMTEVNTSFTELISTGNISLITNENLRSRIIRFYQYSAIIEKSTSNNTEKVFYSNAFPTITNIVIINPSDFNMNVEGITKYNFSESLEIEQKRQLKNPEIQKKLINAINLKIIATTSNKNSINSIIQFAKVLLKEIQKELSNN